MFEYYAPISRVDEGLLQQQLQAAVSPDMTVRRTVGGVLLHTTVDLTQAQIDALEATVNAHTPRRLKPTLTVSQELAAMSTQDRTKVLCAVAAVVLRDHPNLARLLGLGYDADEPDPGP